MENKIKVKFENKEEVDVLYKTKAVDAVKLITKDLNNILALRVNNEVRPYTYELVTNSYVEFIKYQSDDGYRIYTRTLKMILYMALTSLYSYTDVQFISTINRDQYFTIENIELTEEKVKIIKEKMQEIINRKLPIIKKIVSLEEATVLYEASNNIEKVQTLDNKLRSYITMYFCDGMYNYFYGEMAPNTSYVTNFDLLPYRDGALLIIPDENFNVKKEIKENRLYETFISFDKLNDAIGINNMGELNASILEDKIDDVIQVSEAIHDRKMVELVLDIEKQKDIKMVLIAGPSSSGKTTFAQKLGVQLKLTGYNPITISMDNYFKERKDTPLAEDGKYNFECVEALDIALFNKHMKELTEGKRVELPEFDFKVGTKNYKGNYLKLGPKDVLIVEGIHALNPILTEFTLEKNKYKIYIAPIATLNIDGYTKISSSDTRFLRRMLRDYSTRGHSVEQTFELWDKVKKGEETYIFPFVNSANWIYNTSLIYEPSVMKQYVQPLLLQVPKTSAYYSDARRLFEYLNNFLSMTTSHIPIDSIIREFIGEGCFDR